MAASENKIQPSKENARKAIDKLKEIQEAPIIADGETGATIGDLITKEDYDFLVAFLRAAQRKLPKEETITRDRLKKRNAKGVVSL